ncbi:MAG: hypothetical protein AAFN74_14690 [Myxococcota bacterium]
MVLSIRQCGAKAERLESPGFASQLRPRVSTRKHNPDLESQWIAPLDEAVSTGVDAGVQLTRAAMAIVVERA